MNMALLLAVILGNAPSAAAAEKASSLQVSGWVPFWAAIAGPADALLHLDKFDTIYPFVYTLKTDGSLADLGKASRGGADTPEKAAWQSLYAAAKKAGVEIIPTVMSSNGADMERILGDKKLRTKHIKAIISMMKKEKADGINVDYEAKTVATKNDFSKFLKELKKAMGKEKILTCSVEPRTPADSLYRTMPAKIEYSNDFKKIGQYCDRVELMTYDQGRADYRLNDLRAGTPYYPVADKDWVRKVAELAMKDIPKEKLWLGVATYGREYEVTVTPNWFKDYKRVRSLNHVYAMDVAAAYGITPMRNSAGELSFAYLPENGTPERRALQAALPGLPVPAGTQSGDVIAQKALAYANATGKTTSFNIIWWSDAKAIREKIDLARELGLGGVAIFSIDGKSDPAMWGSI